MHSTAKKRSKGGSRRRKKRQRVRTVLRDREHKDTCTAPRGKERRGARTHTRLAEEEDRLLGTLDAKDPETRVKPSSR